MGLLSDEVAKCGCKLSKERRERLNLARGVMLLVALTKLPPVEL